MPYLLELQKAFDITTNEIAESGNEGSNSNEDNSASLKKAVYEDNDWEYFHAPNIPSESSVNSVDRTTHIPAQPCQYDPDKDESLQKYLREHIENANYYSFRRKSTTVCAPNANAFKTARQ